MRDFIRKRPIGSFVVSAFAFSWIVWIAALLFVPEDDQIMWIVPGAYGPSLMAIVVTGIAHGGEGIKRLLSKLLIWRVNIGWYLAVLLVIPLIQLSGVLIYEALNPGSLGPMAPEPLTAWVFAVLLAIPIGPLAEELGWSGYLIPRAQGRFDALNSSLLVGLVWGLWHTPLFFATFGVWVLNDPIRWWSVAVYIAGTIALRVIYTWIYNNTRGSVLIAILLHAVSNAAIPFLLFPDMPDDAAQLAKHWAVLSTAVVAAIIVLVFGRQYLSRSPLVEGETKISPSIVKELA